MYYGGATNGSNHYEKGSKDTVLSKGEKKPTKIISTTNKSRRKDHR